MMQAVPTAIIASAPPPRVEQITPEKAKLMLANNARNRNLRVERVRELANAMKRGEWKLNGETIKVSIDDALLDGQHRLEAIVQSGVTIESVVVRGLPADAQDTIDTGRKRKLSDVLSLEGYSNALELAAALNVLHRRRNGHRLDHSRITAPTVQQALALLATNQGLNESVHLAKAIKKAIGGPAGIYAALHHEFREVDPAATERFFAGLKEGADLSRSNPILQLRNYLVRPRTERTFAVHQSRVAALMIKAFNLHRAGRTVTSLLAAPEREIPAAIRPEDAA